MKSFFAVKQKALPKVALRQQTKYREKVQPQAGRLHLFMLRFQTGAKSIAKRAAGEALIFEKSQ
jgi:hypothetical protein